MESLMRIGELSRRTGVTPELLRAWEQRYQLLRPSRSSGGFRLYSSGDEARVRRTTALIADGLSAAEAARLAATEDEDGGAGQDGDRPLVTDLADHLREALDAFDTAAAHGALDRLLSAVSVEFALSEVLIPYLHDLGGRWASGEATVAQEHFASNLIRARLLGLVQDWGAGGSSTAVVACLPGEAHDLGLVMLSLLMVRRGWQVTFLGADTPIDSLESTVASLRPSVVVLSTYDAALFEANAGAIGRLAETSRVAVLA
ncbi:MAG TPA: MerR family transcriptional regulator, partial [Nocardioides sp.]|uniref:MerR family transcriptional regulator n=1 Tax=Nocardioides sp. TaxID=35761 RepID=UPI002E30C61D